MKQLIAYQKTGSDKHLRDARGVLVTQWGRLNLVAVRRGAQAAGVLDRFEVILEAVHREAEGQG